MRMNVSRQTSPTSIPTYYSDVSHLVLSTYHDKLFDFRLMRMNVSRQASPTSIPTYYSDESYVSKA
ncbi:hypothetical protein J6590_091636 [Homalodisca vitripennis]|nr:hypothetical protein J6590_091636 [Homalodisca vitripennis]